MSDISMCINEDCTLKKKCHRYTAPVNEFYQTYAEFKQDQDGTCEDFWDNKNYKHEHTHKKKD